VLRLDREAFQEVYCLARGVITHDGLPFQLPVEIRTAAFAIVLTAWELGMDRPGLISFTLKTQHAAPVESSPNRSPERYAILLP
jgi:hypothetical protein